MSGAEATFAFVLIWWVTLFAVLPLGVRRSENPEVGHEAGAPENPRLWRKGLLTTAISALLTGVLFVAAEAGLLPLREWLTADPPAFRAATSGNE